MATLIERASELGVEEIMSRWLAVQVGGTVHRAMIPRERDMHLYDTKKWILQMGQEKPERPNKWEGIAQDFCTYVGHAIGVDVKVLGSEMPLYWEVQQVAKNLTAQGYPTQIENGHRDPRLSRDRIVLNVEDGTNQTMRVHFSHPFPGDRRFDPLTNNSAQTRYVMLPDGQVVDLETGQHLKMGDEIHDSIGHLEKYWEDSYPSDHEIVHVAIMVSRFLFNTIRGAGVVNRNPYGALDMPNITRQDLRVAENIRDILPYLSYSTDLEIQKGLTEFRFRSMSAFLLNPKMFLNITKDRIPLDGIFPGIMLANPNQDNGVGVPPRYFRDIEFPHSLEELTASVREVLGDNYDQDMNMLANVAKLFGYGLTAWEEKRLN